MLLNFVYAYNDRNLLNYCLQDTQLVAGPDDFSGFGTGLDYLVSTEYHSKVLYHNIVN